jgi:ferric-dicitrate binding protein FerR (iron transport regulator)
MNETQLWISAYLDGDLTDDERRKLATALAVDPTSLDQLVYDGFVHSQLLDWMGQGRVDDALMANASLAGRPTDPRAMPHPTSDKPMPNNVLLATRVSPRAMTPKRSRIWYVGFLAAALLVAASTSLVAYMLTTRPVIVAQLTQATGCRWDAANSQINVGSLFQNGQELKLLQGSALVTFTSGAQLLLEAPVSLRLDSAMAVHLHDGRIAAKVPTTARDFAVTSSLARFVDLGTAFTLKLAAEKSFELHVFEGLVELQLDRRFGEAVNQPLRVAEVHAVTFDIESGDVAKLDFEEGKQMPF